MTTAPLRMRLPICIDAMRSYGRVSSNRSRYKLPLDKKAQSKAPQNEAELRTQLVSRETKCRRLEERIAKLREHAEHKLDL